MAGMKTNASQLFAWSIAGVAVLALAITAVLGQVGGDSESSAASGASDGGAASYLYVQTADSGTLEVDGEDGYLLTLTGVNPTSTYFADRPSRDAGTFTVEDMLAAVFVSTLTPPNAALVTSDGEREYTLALTLTDPVYDPAAGTLSFAATALEDVPAGLDHLSFDTHADATSVEFGPVELFIDDGFNSCDVTIENYSSYALELDSYSPTSHDRWRGGSPPEFINPNTTVTVRFRFHAENATKHASITYKNAQKSDAKHIEMDFRCDAYLTRGLTCTPPPETTIKYYHCQLPTRSSDSRFTIVNSVIDTTVT